MATLPPRPGMIDSAHGQTSGCQNGGFRLREIHGGLCTLTEKASFGEFKLARLAFRYRESTCRGIRIKKGKILHHTKQQGSTGGGWQLRPIFRDGGDSEGQPSLGPQVSPKEVL